MKIPTLFCFLFLVSLLQAGNWPGFRNEGASRAPEADPPLKWSDDENIAWTVDLPDYGQSSPVIWGDRVLVTSARGENKEIAVVAAYDLQSGNELWTHSFPASVEIPVSKMVSRGAPTPAVDADGVYAFFESGDLVALTDEGEENWRRSLANEYGKFQGNHGVGSSLAQTDEAVIALVDHEGPSYLLAIDKKSGENLWKTDREPRVSWSSPIVWENQILLSSNGVVQAVRVDDGSLIWEFEGIDGNTVASPSVSPDGELVVIGSSAPKMSRAFDRKTGDLAWVGESVTSSFGSPLIYEDCVYFVNRAGALQCVDAESGNLLWETRLSDSCWASPVAASGRLYFFSNDGTTSVFAPNRNEPEKLAENPLSALHGDRVYGVAFADGSIVARTGLKLVCIRAQ